MRPGTGILPLIPDYISFETGLFVMASKKSEQFSFELGGRYDYLDQRVATISRDVVKEIKRYYNYASNMGLAGGGNYAIFKWNEFIL